MPKFYAKIDEGVEGPFEPHLLKYLSGFTEETLVSLEDLSVEEWKKALDVPEVRRHLGASQELLPPGAFNREPVLQKAPPSANETVRLYQPPAHSPEAKPAGNEQELLDVMEQFSDQLISPEAHAAPPTTPDAPAPRITPPLPDISTLVPPVQEKFVPKRAVKSKWTTPILLALLVVAGALGYMAFKMGMLEQWKSLADSFLSRNAPALPQIEVPPPVQDVKPAEVQPVEPPPKPLKAHKTEKKPEKKAIKKYLPVPKPQAKKPKPAPPEEPLKTQKYMMPGVPAPKMQEKPKEPEKPAEEAPIESDTEKSDAAYERELKRAKEQEEAEAKAAAKKEKKEKKKKKAADENEADYFDYQWIGADPGEKK